MSQANIESFERGVDAINSWDLEAMLDGSRPEIEWQPVLQVLLGGTATVFKGHEGVRAIVRDLRSTFDQIDIQIRETREAGDTVVGLGNVHGLSKQGVEIDSEYGIVVRYVDGLAIHGRDWYSHAEALAAAGFER